MKNTVHATGSKLAILTIGCLVFGGISGCGQSSSTVRENQRHPIASPSGNFVATLPINIGTTYVDTPVWIVTICDSAGNQLHEDTSSNFIGTLSVYWLWDNDDRFWLYNSDDGTTWYWEQTGEQWTKTKWTNSLKADGLSPPPTLSNR